MTSFYEGHVWWCQRFDSEMEAKMVSEKYSAIGVVYLSHRLKTIYIISLGYIDNCAIVI